MLPRSWQLQGGLLQTSIGGSFLPSAEAGGSGIAYQRAGTAACSWPTPHAAARSRISPHGDRFDSGCAGSEGRTCDSTRRAAAQKPGIHSIAAGSGRPLPQGAVIRLILDNHSAHISKETRGYLASKPNRFRYVQTPTHGSWLNLVETLFCKMAHAFLPHIRVESWNELRNRILRGVEEINASPVVHRWKKFDALDDLRVP
jgi:hypothetical protein